MDDDIKQHLSAKSTWIRGVYILLFALFYSVAEFVLFAVVVFQFLATLLTGQANERVQRLGHSIATYFYQIICFMTGNTEQRPYPFNPWPAGPPGDGDNEQVLSVDTEETRPPDDRS
jgi:hypothetical protein